ncbi:MAG: proton-conducting transporter membrane subunit [Actinomycetota bacterium]|nr:proton-conducting transporter membrane subunit [Actinomycetota bacterium]
MLIIAILLIPLIMTVVAASVPWRPWVGWATAASSGAFLALGVALSVATMSAPQWALHHSFRADSLSAFMVIVIGAVSLLATSFTSRTMRQEMESGATTARYARHYAVLMQVFITCMLSAVLTANLGVLWVSIEATTIATTFLVSHRRTDAAFEASWKYVILCSIGIALAFLGTVLIYYAQLHASGPVHSSSLDWTSVMSVAHHLDPNVTRLAFALLVVGYGTKVGLVPMHSWLPDAHSQAPAPVSALMSGVLLSVAFYGLLRFRAIAVAALGPVFPRALLLVVGLVSLLLATVMLIAQRDLKRMLAYSSIEHMGLLAIGAAVGSPLAIAAVLLHILGHGITKAVLFLSSGEIYHLEGSTEIDKISGLLARRPTLAGIFGFGVLSLVALPPFSLFVSELTMARAEVDAGLWWVVAISLGCLSVIFAAVTRHTRQMLMGAASVGSSSSPLSVSVALPLISALVACVALGVLAWPLQSLLTHAAQGVLP